MRSPNEDLTVFKKNKRAIVNLNKLKILKKYTPVDIAVFVLLIIALPLLDKRFAKLPIVSHLIGKVIISARDVHLNWQKRFLLKRIRYIFPLLLFILAVLLVKSFSYKILSTYAGF